MPQHPKSCLFCGTPLRPKKSKKDGKSDEHIIPEWLIDHLGIRKMVITPMRTESASGRILDARQHVLPAFVAGMVCGTCNRGWMSDLEQQSKPILVSLIADPNRLSSLSTDERNTIARWTLKTAAVLNRSSTYGSAADKLARPVPDSHLREVMNGWVPNDVVVVAGGYASSKPFDWLQYATWATPSNSIPLLETERNRSYKIGLAFRDLVLAVAYYPSSEYRYGVMEGHYVPLWEGGRGIVPVPRQMDDSPAQSNSPVLEGFLRNLFVLSKTWLELVGNLATTRLIVP
jgi:hypothetical protein